MLIDLSKFKVVYGDLVFRAVSLQSIEFSDKVEMDAQYKKPKVLEIIVINEDGNILAIRDESWRFQFVPVMK